ncbi:MAG TPA: DUF4215 domain-containing protein [Candidatus Nanoarchaeia archaeon]|nr:DUF4215 domain-containing protein [Candidatus Nanoarchaeia archaeon]
MKKLLILVSMLVMFLLVVSCAPQELTDEELDAELAKLTPEERAELLADLEAKESGALAGQASKEFTAKYARKISPKVLRVSTIKLKYRLTAPPGGGSSSPPSSPTAVCGDGVTTPPEQCDDGNTANDDSCTTTCTLTGNKAALVIIAESVEYSLDSTNQNVKVTATVKNLGNAATGNGFDVGFTQSTVFGHPVTNQPAPALAVDESATVSVTLNAHCPSPADGGHSISIFADSGNKVVETSKADNWHSLTYNCGPALGNVCGDGIQNSTEQCDDGNTVSGDGCSYPLCEIDSPAPKPVNNNPTITVSDVTGEQGSYPSFTIQANDPDGDALTFHKLLGVGINDADFVLNANGFTGWHVPLDQAPGEYTVKYLVSDGKGGKASAEAKFTVTAASS